MIDKLTLSILNCLTCHYERCEIERLKIKYGIQLILNMLTKILVSFLIGAIIGLFMETLLLVLFFGIIRLYSGGAHYDSDKMCWIVTVAIFVGGALFSNVVDMNIYFFVVSILTATVLLWKYAPSQTTKNPIPYNCRRSRKYRVVLFSLLYLLIGITCRNEITMVLIFIAVWSNVISVLPMCNRN